MAWSRTAAGRARDGIIAAYASPRTRGARTGAAAFARRAAAGVGELGRSGSVYVRRQYDRDPRQTLIVAGVAAAVLVLVLVLLASAVTGGGDGATTADERGAAQPGIGTPLASEANGTSATATAATPTATAAQPLPGNPYSETAVLDAMRSRGLTVASSTDPFACDSPGTTPRTYRISANGAEQRIVLLVYPDAGAYSRDWAPTGGRPQYRNGSCAAGAALVYFNINVMLVFPQTNNAGVQQRIADAFLALP